MDTSFDDDFVANLFVTYIAHAGGHIFGVFHQHIFDIQRCVYINGLVYIFLMTIAADNILHADAAPIYQSAFHVGDDIHLGQFRHFYKYLQNDIRFYHVAWLRPH